MFGFGPSEGARKFAKLETNPSSLTDDEATALGVDVSSRKDEDEGEGIPGQTLQ